MCSLTAQQAERTVALAKETTHYFESPTNFSQMVFDRALLELAFMVLGNIKEVRLPELLNTSIFKVQSAIEWYSEHISKAPRVEDVAAVVHVSVSNLRRLFMLTMNESPQSVFKRVRMRAAMKMMAESKVKLDVVAAECGYSSASDFSRAFSKEFSVSPSVWRENDYSSIPDVVMSRPWLGEKTWTPQRPFSDPV